MAKLTKRIVDDAKAGEQPYFLWDGEVRGFGLMVLPGGVKTFIVQYRNEARRSRRLKIGRHGTLTIDEAKDVARAVLVEVSKGGDPAANRRNYREAPTVGELLDKYFQDHVCLHNAPSTQSDVSVIISNHLKPRLGALKVADLSRIDVSKLHLSMKSTPRRANYVIAILSKALSLAEVWGVRSQHSNPCKSLQRYRENHRTRFLKHEEVKRLHEALEEAESIGLPWNVEGREPKHLAKQENRRTRLSWQAVAVIRVLMLTGARLSEITGLKWTDVDLSAQTIALPGKKGGKREPFPVGAATIEIISALPRIKSSPYVFPRDQDHDRHIAKEVMESAWQRLRWRAEIEDVRIHDLRHTVGTYAAQAGVSSFIVRDLLRHTNISTTARYANFDSSPVREVANIVSSRIKSAS